MSDEEENDDSIRFGFEVDVDVTHNIPPELADTMEFSDDSEVNITDE